MDKLKKDITLLEECIKHWQRVKEGLDQPTDISCSLCQEYSPKDCMECPIYHKTGKDCCTATPYKMFIIVMGCNNYQVPIELSPRGEEKAQDMLNFLVNLKLELEERCNSEQILEKED